MAHRTLCIAAWVSLLGALVPVGDAGAQVTGEERGESLIELKERGLDDVTILGKFTSGDEAARWTRFVAEVLQTDVSILQMQDEYLVMVDSEWTEAGGEMAEDLMARIRDAATEGWAGADSSTVTSIWTEVAPDLPDDRGLSFYHGSWNTVVKTRLERFEPWLTDGSIESTPLHLVPNLEGAFGSARLSRPREGGAEVQVFDVTASLLEGLGSIPRAFTLELGGESQTMVALWREDGNTFRGFSRGSTFPNVTLLRTEDGWLGLMEEDGEKWHFVPDDGGYVPVRVMEDTLITEGRPRIPDPARDTVGPQAASDAGDPVIARTRRAAAEQCEPGEPVDILWVFSDRAARTLSERVMGLTTGNAVTLWTAALNEASAPYRFRSVGVVTSPIPDARLRTYDILEMATDGGGSFREVHRSRERLQADLVHVVTDPPWDPADAPWPDTCGEAWVIHDRGWSAYGYSVAPLRCQLTRWSSLHEIGHNLGMQHDPGDAGPPDPVFTYSRGFSRDGNHTIMARNGNRRRIFSTPAGRFGDGVPAGYDATRNRETLGKTHCWIRQFR